MIGRSISTLLILALSVIVNLLVNAPATLLLGQNAGRQFEPSDPAYLVTQALFRGFNGLSVLIGAVTLFCIFLIWIGPARKAIAALTGTVLRTELIGLD